MIGSTLELRKDPINRSSTSTLAITFLVSWFRSTLLFLLTAGKEPLFIASEIIIWRSNSTMGNDKLDKLIKWHYTPTYSNCSAISRPGSTNSDQHFARYSLWFLRVYNIYTLRLLFSCLRAKPHTMSDCLHVKILMRSSDSISRKNDMMLQVILVLLKPDQTVFPLFKMFRLLGNPQKQYNRFC